MSKIFERLIFKQICPFAYRLLSNLLCAFREGHSAEHALFRLTEICRKALADGRVVRMVLMDLSKAYDCITNDLLIAKLAAYGLDHCSLLLIYSYLSSRKQGVKVGSEFSDWLEIKSGVPQGSVLGPLFFNIFINDLLLEVKELEICNFADDTTIYTNGNNIANMILSLEEDLSNTLNWFRVNHMATNPGKFQVIFLGIREQPKLILEINDTTIPLTDKVKLLGVTIDSQLKFDDHIKALCQIANRKVSAFSRVAPYLNQKRGKILYNTFVMSKFNYCPLIWMYHGKNSNNRIDRVQKRALRIWHNDFNMPFEVLLSRTDERKVHIKNLQKLMLQIYKCLSEKTPSFMVKFFEKRDIKYELRTKNLLQTPIVKTNTIGANSLISRGAHLWNTLPDDIKNVNLHVIFKRKTKKWNGDKCNCKICK